MWWLVPALAGDAVVVEAETSLEVAGPAVVLDEFTYRTYVRESRLLSSCEETLGAALDEASKANRRVLDARELARIEFEADEKLIDTQVQTIAAQSVALDRNAVQLHQLKNQRNVAVGVAVGFLAAATTAVVLSLN